MNRTRYVVVGGGIVGLATARELLHRHPGAWVTVVEKEERVGLHQTSRNSGVVHAGLYYPAGSLKARLCRRGRALLEEFCRERGLPYEECGKVVVARTPDEVGRLDDIEARARANEVPGLRRLDRSGLEQVEPHAAGVAALHSPHTAITDFSLVAEALASELDVRTGFEVQSIRTGATDVVVASGGGELAADRVIICAGLHSDALARRAGAAQGPRIVPFRGEYWRLVPVKSGLVRGLIYPVPDPRYPFLGVHFTRRVSGHVDLGPNAVLGLAREAYRWRDVDPVWVTGLLTDRRFWAMARANWRAGAHELTGSVSKHVFVSRAAALVPEVTSADVERAPTGVRAQAVDRDGSLLDDFRITRVGTDSRVMGVVNAPSPAATSCLAIAEYICDSIDG